MRIYASAKLFLALCLSAVGARASYNTENLTPINVERSDYEYFTFTVNTGFVSMDKVNSVENDEYLSPKFNNSVVLNGEIGAPGLWKIENLIAIPFPDGAEIISAEPVNIMKFNGRLAPNPNYVKQDLSYDVVYKPIQSKYDTYKFPGYAKIENAGVFKNKYAARVTAFPVSYDNYNNEVSVAKEIKITIKFKPLAKGKKSLATNKFKLDYSALLNGEQTNNWAAEYTGEQILENNYQNLDDLSSGTWLKLKTSEEGVYRIDASTLTAKGFVNTPANVKTIKIFGNGGANLSESVIEGGKSKLNEQSIITETDGEGKLTAVVFYGAPAYGFTVTPNREIRHYLNDFSFDNYYLMTWGVSEGKRADNPLNLSGDPVNKPTVYTARLFKEEELDQVFLDGGGRQWFGKSYFSEPYTNTLSNIVADGMALVRVGAAQTAATSYSSNFNVYLNSKKLGSIKMPSCSSDDFRRDYENFTVNASDLNKNNSLKFDYELIEKGSTGTGYLDYYEIHYPREFVPIDNTIEFIADTTLRGLTQYKIGGFSGNVYAFEVFSPGNPTYIKNQSSAAGEFSFKDINEAKKYSRYFISSKLLTPGIEQITLANLRGKKQNAQVIVITHSDLMDGAQKFAEYRAKKSGMKITITNVDDIYNEFGSGIKDITAIRNYIKYCYDNWDVKPEYVVLWGDGHYDYRNIAVKNTNFIPPYEIIGDTDNLTDMNAFATDDYYARIVGEDPLNDIAIGRVPCYNKETSIRAFNKIYDYENNSSKDTWRTNFLLVADDAAGANGVSGDGNSFVSNCEEISGLADPGLINNKLYIAQFPVENIPGGKRKPGAAAELLYQVNTKGALVFNWIGHGNPNVLAHERIFERETTIPQMGNYDKLFFMIAATCDFGRYDKKGTACSAEELLTSKVGGAVAVFAASRSVYSGYNQALHKDVVTNLFKKNYNSTYPTLGQCVLNSKISHYDSNSLTYILLGDPTMKLNLPELTVKADTINGIAVNDSSNLEIKGLTKVKISGKILSPNGLEINDKFNGAVILSFFDGDEQISFTDLPSGTDFNFMVNGGALNRSTFKVTNGRFNAEFIVPGDIANSALKARLYMYAYSDSGEYAKGFNKCIKIKGVSSTSVQDKNGPNIKLYLDDRSFVAGETVRATPMLIADLSDESGINSSGLGLGHKIEAWVDDSPNPINLTDKFFTSFEDPKAGSVQDYLLGLSPGLHTVKVRAWDVYNNYSVASVDFIIPGANTETITDAYLTPNPTTGPSKICIKHNCSVPAAAEIKIYNSVGALVKTISGTIFTPHTSYFDWAGNLDSGETAPSGYYYAVITIDRLKSTPVVKSHTLGVIAR